MPLVLLPLEPEDALPCLKISIAAFGSDFHKALFPNGFSAEAEAWCVKEMQANMQWHGDHGVYKHLNKVVDTDLPDDDPYNKIISMASWTFMPKERSLSDVEAEMQKADSLGRPPGQNNALYDAFLGKMTKHRAEVWGGKPYAVLLQLATHPDHHRRGAGGIHLKWGMEKADKDGLPLWLEASPDGKPLYERYGWKVIDKLDIDPRDFGLPYFEALNMLRDGKVIVR